MERDPEPLHAIAATTIGHYEANARDYAERTADHDVAQNVATLVRHLEGAGPFALLDFGCGPGRDLPALAANGEAIGLDGSAAFVRMAREATGATVLHQDFVALDLPPARFDGIFANASLQHVPASALPRVLGELRASLKDRGVLFASIPHGDDEAGWNGQRYSTFHAPASWRRFMSTAGFVELEHYFRPEGRPRDEQRWFASAWRRT